MNYLFVIQNFLLKQNEYSQAKQWEGLWKCHQFLWRLWWSFTHRGTEKVRLALKDAIFYYFCFPFRLLKLEQFDESERKVLTNKCICILYQWPFFDAFENFYSLFTKGCCAGLMIFQLNVSSPIFFIPFHFRGECIINCKLSIFFTSWQNISVPVQRDPEFLSNYRSLIM